MAKVIDLGGYEAQPRDFDVAGIDETAILAMQGRKAPLGFTEDDWKRCVDELRDALRRSGIEDADVRIRGSATQFFSGEHKPFPPSLASLLERPPSTALPVNELRERWQRLGFEEGSLPNYHYFNSRYALGLDPPPSDYDIQLSSDTVVARLDEYRRMYSAEDVISPHGGHYRHEYLARLFPDLGNWADAWAEHTGCDVTIASFAGSGPTGSSSFAKTDWVIIEGEG